MSRRCAASLGQSALISWVLVGMFNKVRTSIVIMTHVLMLHSHLLSHLFLSENISSPSAAVNAAVNPGFSLALSNAGLEYARSIGVPILEKAIATASIPDVSASKLCKFSCNCNRIALI